MLFEVELSKLIKLFVVADDETDAEIIANAHVEDELVNYVDREWFVESVAQLTELADVTKSDRSCIPWGDQPNLEEKTVGELLAEFEAEVKEAEEKAKAEARQVKMFGD